MPSKCKPKPDGSVALPVVTPPKHRKKAKIGTWRAGVLIGVHLLIAAHIVQWLIQGRTVSPVEPSESMQTLEQGLLNAGAIFFALAILSTVLVGRYMCGWLCHVVALQDFCHWLMGKAGIRPKPFRSRLMMLGPLALGLYMFVWPSFKRFALQPALAALGVDWPWWLRRTQPFPGLQSELFVEDFWATFPEWYIAIPFLLVCGFATVYVLGAKGFCFSACPYGGIFALAEPVAPVRVRVDHAKCHECGLCTAACTSNVRVHEEIKHHGMVVDAGCMKTMDCIAACPNDALSIGLGRPAIGAPVRPEKRDDHRQAKKKANRRWDLTWPQELAFALVFVFTFIATRGMFDRVPMLMAGGLAGVGTGLTALLYKQLTTPNARLHKLVLKKKGKTSPAGIVFALAMAAWWLFTAWGGAGNITRWRAEALHAGVGVPADAVLRPEFAASETTKQRARDALRWYARADAFNKGGVGWTLTPDDLLRIAYLHAVLGEYAQATDTLRSVVKDGNPTDGLVFQLLALHSAAARIAIDAAPDNAARAETVRTGNERYMSILTESLEQHPSLHTVRLRLAQELWNQGAYDPDIWNVDDETISADPRFILNATQFRARSGDRAAMSEALDRVLALEPEAPALLFEISQLARSIGRNAEAETALQDGIALAHDAPTLLQAARIFVSAGRPDDARRVIEDARHAYGAAQPGVRFQTGRLLYALGETDLGLSLMRQAESDLAHDPWQRLGVLSALAQLSIEAQDPSLLTDTIERLETLVQRHPDEPVFRHDLSGFLFNTGRQEDAVQAIIEAAEIGADNAILAERAAQLLGAVGRNEEAARWLEQAASRKARTKTP